MAKLEFIVGGVGSEAGTPQDKDLAGRVQETTELNAQARAVAENTVSRITTIVREQLTVLQKIIQVAEAKQRLLTGPDDRHPNFLKKNGHQAKLLEELVNLLGQYNPEVSRAVTLLVDCREAMMAYERYSNRTFSFDPNAIALLELLKTNYSEISKIVTEHR